MYGYGCKRGSPTSTAQAHAMLHIRTTHCVMAVVEHAQTMVNSDSMAGKHGVIKLYLSLGAS